MKSQIFQSFIFLVLLVLIFFGVHAAIMRTDVEGSSMEPNLHDKQLMMLVKAAYWFSDPGRGDVIVFVAPPNPEKDYVKRIIGLPGDTVECKSGVVYVNGKPLKEPYTQGTTCDFAATPVPEGQYFVLGDNRQNSNDSRYWGFVPRENIMGRVWFVFWPVGESHLLYGFSYDTN